MATPSGGSLGTGGGTKRKANEDLVVPTTVAVSQPEPTFGREITQSDPYSKVPLAVDGKLLLLSDGKLPTKGTPIDVLYRTTDKCW
jgi:hypothetical protein